MAERYSYFYKGECNADMDTNGEAKLLEDLLKDGGKKCIFDVGANVGDYTERVLKLNPDVDIHCFEPSVEAFTKLKSRFTNISLNNLGLGDKAEQKYLYTTMGESSFSSFYSQNGSKSNREKIEVITLDLYCLSHSINHIDLLKIDTEGSELSILSGSERMIKNEAIDVIQFEYGHASLPAHILIADFVGLFKNYGYILYKMKLDGLELVRYTPWMEGCPYANFVAVKQGYVIW